MLKKFLVPAIVGAASALTVIACAQPGPGGEPVQNIDPARHGNLAAAQRLAREAFDRITAAQQANEYDLGGHAGRAKEFLRQANDELRQAAITINQRR